MPKSKRFDKKNAVTFHLVHRSQQDPLVADENAPQHVLQPVSQTKETSTDKEKRLEEQHKYGIYFDDDYNYLEHLKDAKDNRMEWPAQVEDDLKTRETRKVKFQLPSSVFASEVEEEVGMLNKATPLVGPQLQFDPDIVAAMDEDFDYDDPDNQLEDNFIELASGVASDQDYDDEEYEDEADDEVGSLQGSEFSFNEEETKSRFTNYSMTSSVIRRNEQLSLLDDRFEKMYEGYDENEIGALDCEEIEGYVPESADILLQFADEFKKQQAREHLEKDVLGNKIKESLIDEETGSEEEMENVVVPEKEKWDCESILSTYSNLYNHPKLITEPRGKIKISTRTGIPKNVLDANKLTARALDRLNEENDIERGLSKVKGPKSMGGQSIISQLSTLSIRAKNESPEERKERKKLLKDYKRERRLEKKTNTEAFKEEKRRQIKISINNRNNVQGNKIM